MFRATTKFWLVSALLLWGGQSVFGFSLAGPIGNNPQPIANDPSADGDAWQTQAIGYGLVGPNYADDAVAPKNLAEEYRWNTRNIYYAFDTSFLEYFGTNGAAQIDAAFALLNNLSNVDSYSPSLSEWPLTSSRINYPAAEVDMFDLKSAVLVEMMEQLGLASPDRYAYTLHDRVPPLTGPACPNYEYLITQRNFDPVTQNYSSYVNGVLYTFQILETCPLPAAAAATYAPLVADVEDVPVDPDQYADAFSAVAAGQLGGIQNPLNSSPFTLLGRYYLNLTRDDIGGFKYLWSSNTINNESVDPNSLLQAVAPPSLIVTSNLALFEADLTNTPAALQALFPTLQITSSTFSYFSNVLVTNFVVGTNYSACIGQPVGCVPPVVTNAVVSTNLLPIYSYTFGNLLTNFTYTNNGVLVSNSPSEYILVPANVCGFQILSNALTSVVEITNTNSLAVTLFTNHTLVVDVFTCIPNSVALREGMEKMNFFRVDYDDLISSNWPGVTNTYTLTAISNNRPVIQTFYRVTTQPDIIFSASDLVGGPGALPLTFGFVRTPPTFNQTTVPVASGLAGPGTIEPTPIHMVFNKSGPIFIVDQSSGAFLTETPVSGGTNVSDYQWASFDGTTNAPVVYPPNNSYANLVNSIFLQITTPGSLADGTVNVPYSVELQASGAAPPPYTYSVVSGSGVLPNGLNLTQSGGNTFISGTPTVVGIFDFTLQVADSTGRASQRNFSLEIDQ